MDVIKEINNSCFFTSTNQYFTISVLGILTVSFILNVVMVVFLCLLNRDLNRIRMRSVTNEIELVNADSLSHNATDTGSDGWAVNYLLRLNRNR